MRLRVLLLVIVLCVALVAANRLLTRPLPVAAEANLPVSQPLTSLAAETNSTTYLYIPQIANDYCGPFFDSFEDNAALWFTGAFDGLRAEIIEGEYRLAFAGRGVVWMMPGPVCGHAAYRAAVDAHWEGEPGNFIGLLIGIDDTRERAYLFAVNTDARAWLVFEVVGDSLDVVVAPTGHDAVLPGGAINRLAAERRENTLILSINDTPVGELPIAQPGAPVLAGVVAAAYTHQTSATARFDNFRYEPVFGE